VPLFVGKAVTALLARQSCQVNGSV
jgi:hypothetical protein